MVFYNYSDPALFFDGMFPGTIASADDLQPLCVERLPQLPTSSVGVHSGSSEDGVSYSYCVVGTARGTFRSSSIRDGLTGSQSKSDVHSCLCVCVCVCVCVWVGVWVPCGCVCLCK